MALLINDAELQALAGLPFAAVTLYLMGIRPRMDLSTGMVGVRFLISWQALRESLYVEPSQNRQESGSMHESKVRRLAGVLERAGLVKISSSITNRQLIFKCLLATTDKSVQNKSDRQSDRQSDRPQQAQKPATARKTKPATQEADRQSDRESDTHPSFSSVVDISSRRPSEEGDDDDIQKLEKRGLVFTLGSEELKAEVCKMVEGLNLTDAQRVLDQLAGAMREKQIRSPLRYLRTTIKNFQQGDFTGELAAAEARSRSARQKAAQESIQAKNKPVYRENTAAAREALAKAKAITGGRRAAA